MYALFLLDSTWASSSVSYDSASASTATTHTRKLSGEYTSVDEGVIVFGPTRPNHDELRDFRFGAASVGDAVLSGVHFAAPVDGIGLSNLQRSQTNNTENCTPKFRVLGAQDRGDGVQAVTPHHVALVPQSELSRSQSLL